jgi:hypothetical protein
VKVEHSGGVEHKTRLVIPDGATDETIAAMAAELPRRREGDGE